MEDSLNSKISRLESISMSEDLNLQGLYDQLNNRFINETNDIDAEIRDMNSLINDIIKESNENLIYNWDFTNPVQSFTTMRVENSGTFRNFSTLNCIDGYRIHCMHTDTSYKGYTEVNVINTSTDNYITISYKGNEAAYFSSLAYYHPVSRATMTFSIIYRTQSTKCKAQIDQVKYAGRYGYFHEVTLPTSDDFVLYTTTFERGYDTDHSPTDAINIIVQDDSNEASIDIKAVKLEYGDTSTLCDKVYDDSNKLNTIFLRKSNKAIESIKVAQLYEDIRIGNNTVANIVIYYKVSKIKTPSVVAYNAAGNVISGAVILITKDKCTLAVTGIERIIVDARL